MNTDEIYIALAGNPNVGKSTVFNALTGMHQHTGNWTGKTVSTARGEVSGVNGEKYILTDLPGTYSLMAHSAEEQVARDFICFSGSRAVIVVCDGGALERNLNLALQVMEITPHVLLCVNLLDEAEKKGITVDTEKLSETLHVPVCGTAARNGVGLDKLLEMLPKAFENTLDSPPVTYDENIERAVSVLEKAVEPLLGGILSPRFAALRILEDCDITETLDSHTQGKLSAALSDRESPAGKAFHEAREILRECGITKGDFRDMTVTAIVSKAAETAEKCVDVKVPDYYERDRKIDRILTHRIWGLPVMLLILTAIFFITIKLANYPSEWLSHGFASLGGLLRRGLDGLSAPPWLTGLLMDGVYNVLTWVASVMLPPMAIFFPMFSLLEDVGYLPRAAFNLDRFF
ncbi:MAG: ferrous iron transporter B, partial [Ruminococcus sp.]|nr:ferrous iron transporter B [Ruminococcus sp.]